MGIIKNIFAWWDGATAGTHLMTWRKGVFVGEDSQGNRYFTDRAGKKRWVIYKGYAEPSRVPAIWHGWLHYTVDEPPTVSQPQSHAWEKEHVPNMTGTPYAYRPKGSLYASGPRAKSGGDYEAWTPD